MADGTRTPYADSPGSERVAELDLDAIYHWGALSIIGVAGIAFPALFLITVPYGGRHVSDRWGPRVPSRLAWMLMELPAPIFCLWAYTQGRHAGDPVSLLFLAAFEAHYLQRAIIYPLRMRSTGKRTPLSAASIAIATNIANGTVTGLALSHATSYATSWLWNPRFLLGAAAFVFGLLLNLRSEAIVRNLRAPGESGYGIPFGGCYRWVASPNYLGEIIQWVGWALATWSLGGLAFALLTIANLVPRARSNLIWYRNHFPNHPPERRALLPLIW